MFRVQFGLYSAPISREVAESMLPVATEEGPTGTIVQERNGPLAVRVEVDPHDTSPDRLRP